ncbi:hypothetical protein MSPP1_001507 [Malassezia sp. CBS 17886]|nr:hypothetical protein MSPP1_001507 [Malassezia sp. CBS 17886]
MVCQKCEKLLSKTAAPDPYAGFLVASGSATKARGVGGGASAPAGGGRKIGENKLLSGANRYSPVGLKCQLCKQPVRQEKATYCQACAYKKGLCAICGKQILDTKRYKQSS